MSTVKTFFEWCVPYFSGYCIIKEMDRGLFLIIFLNIFLGLEGTWYFMKEITGDSRILF